MCVGEWVYFNGGAVTPPVPCFKRNESLRDGEVDEVEVEVRQAQVVQGLLAGWEDVLVTVVRVPQLGRDPQVLAGHQALLDGALDAQPDLLFVAIVARRVDVPHTGFDRLVHDVAGDGDRNLPRAKTDGRDGSEWGEAAHGFLATEFTVDGCSNAAKVVGTSRSR